MLVPQGNTQRWQLPLNYRKHSLHASHRDWQPEPAGFGLFFFEGAALMMELPKRHAAPLEGSRFVPIAGLGLYPPCSYTKTRTLHIWHICSHIDARARAPTALRLRASPPRPHSAPAHRTAGRLPGVDGVLDITAPM
jgi:hypothetical protein